MERRLEDTKNEMAIVCEELSRTPDDHLNRPTLLVFLGSSQMKRFKLLRSAEDIQRVIEFATSALQLVPEDDLRPSRILIALAVFLEKRFGRHEEIGDIHQVIEYRLKGISMSLVSKTNANCPLYLKSLAISYGVQFKRLGEPDDIEKAIEYQSRVVELTPEGHPCLPSYLANLAISHKKTRPAPV
jgi:tetratricopeptide (TPR) repeat protein